MNDCDLFATYPARQSPTLTHPTVVPQFFTFYTASLLPVANVVLKIDGETSDIQSHSPPSTTSGSAGVGWGPFAVTSSFSHTDTQASSSCEATATGRRIMIKSPQIIGLISEIVPTLPRLKQ